MPRFERTVRIDAPRDRVWSLLADFGGIERFHPGLRASRSTSARNEGIGASRHCELRPAGSVEERAVGWDEGRSLRVEIYAGRGTPPLDFRRSRIRFELRDDGAGTAVDAVLDYRLRYGPLGALLDRAVVRARLARSLELVLGGLKTYAEHGRKATRADLARLRPALAPARRAA